MTSSLPAIPVATRSALESFSLRWHVLELSLFGSILRSDFDDASDVDVLVEFEPGVAWDPWTEWPVMLDELSEVFGGRRVDLVERKDVKNPYVRDRIMDTRTVVYAA